MSEEYKKKSYYQQQDDYKTRIARLRNKEFPNFSPGKIPQYNEEFISLGDYLRSWVKEFDAIDIGDFAHSIGFSVPKFKKFAERNESFKESLEFALSVIASRREKLFTFDKAVLRSDLWVKKQPIYDKELAEWEEAKHKKDTAAATDRIMNIIMNKAPNTDVVKPLPAREEDAR